MSQWNPARLLGGLVSTMGIVSASLILPGGALADPVTFVAKLSSDNQGQQSASPGIGSAIVTVDTVNHTLQVSLSFHGLQNPTTAAHIHCLCTEPAGTQITSAATQVPSFKGFPLGVKDGNYSEAFDSSLPETYSPRFLKATGGTAAAAEAALFAGLVAGQAYVNVHTVGTERLGEIRGALQRSP